MGRGISPCKGVLSRYEAVRMSDKNTSCSVYRRLTVGTQKFYVLGICKLQRESTNKGQKSLLCHASRVLIDKKGLHTAMNVKSQIW